MLHFHFAEDPRRGASLIHRLDPRVKILGTLLFILAATLAPPGAWVAFVLLLAGALVVSRASELGAGYALKRSFVALPFALAAITLPFTVPGQTTAQFGSWTISAEGSVRFLSILVKSWISVQMAILLVAVTRFPDLIHALEHLKVPAILTTIIAFLYRYLFVLTDEVFRLIRARESRSAASAGNRAGGGVLWRAKVAGNMAGQLFLRSYERSDRIYNAMLSRGYSGHLYTLNPHEMKPADYYVTAFVIAVIFIVQVLGRF